MRPRRDTTHPLSQWLSKGKVLTLIYDLIVQKITQKPNLPLSGKKLEVESYTWLCREPLVQVHPPFVMRLRCFGVSPGPPAAPACN